MHSLLENLDITTVSVLVAGACACVAILAMFYREIRLEIKDKVTLFFRRER
jgi:hypothetical protein